MWLHQVEADIRPFRGILLGLFFVTTGSSLDLALLFQQWPIVLALTGGLISVKVGIIGSVAPLFGLSKSVNLTLALLSQLPAPHRVRLPEATAWHGDLNSVLSCYHLAFAAWDPPIQLAVGAILFPGTYTSHYQVTTVDTVDSQCDPGYRQVRFCQFSQDRWHNAEPPRSSHACCMCLRSCTMSSSTQAQRTCSLQPPYHAPRHQPLPCCSGCSPLQAGKASSLAHSTPLH